MPPALSLALSGALSPAFPGLPESGAPPLESGAGPVVNRAAVLAIDRDTVAAQRLGVDEHKAGEDFDHVDQIWLDCGCNCGVHVAGLVVRPGTDPARHHLE